jgi:hypothetical protein
MWGSSASAPSVPRPEGGLLLAYRLIKGGVNGVYQEISLDVKRISCILSTLIISVPVVLLIYQKYVYRRRTDYYY